MTEFEGQVLADLCVLKSQMEQLVGGQQPGRLHRLEERVARNEVAVQRMKGATAAFGTVLTLLHLAISYLGGRHG